MTATIEREDRMAPVRGAQRPRGGRTARWPALLYLGPGMLGFAIFIVVPLAVSLVISVFDWPLLGSPKFVGLENYRYMLAGDPAFWRSLLNTLIFAVLYTAVNLAVALGLSYWLMNLGGRWAAFFRVLFFIPVVTPMIGNALVFRLLLDDDGVVNGVLAHLGITGPQWLNTPGWAMVSLVMMSLWQGMGYNIIVLGAGIAGINPSVLEASRIDGAGPVNRFFRVVFPMLSPTIFFCTIMTVIGAFKVFTQPYALTEGGPGNATNTLVLHLYRNGFSFDRLGYASALAWALFVIVMLITAVQFSQQKRWVSYDS
ncbi:carbohydrate ABC transporter permease [Brachybacterium sp. ACRRE]|uniref:carbohydrate ABC transporter permease n=1 Tax=Brachybacterium sp. ACRRE TaxID=2918184 RepID=UPI001EF3A4FB|nr:sugar ABC transporter permease [Brachybacterium sp. ACRRE]MCG7310309.1 sugar ABC transporter permease [Brachybacterium sp. ACRRE]